MELMDAIRTRRSVRVFDGRPVEREVIDILLDAATYAPSRMNSQPWRFYVATGDARKAVGEAMAMTTAHLEEYIGAFGPEVVENASRLYADLGSAPVAIGVSSPSVSDAEVARDNAISVGAAIQNILLAAHDRGLGACNISAPHWVRDRLAEVFGVPDGWQLMSIILLGHPAEKPHERQRETNVVTYLP